MYLPLPNSKIQYFLQMKVKEDYIHRKKASDVSYFENKTNQCVFPLCIDEDLLLEYNVRSMAKLAVVYFRLLSQVCHPSLHHNKFRFSTRPGNCYLCSS